MIFTSTLNNKTYTFEGSDMVSKSVLSGAISFVAGDILHIDVDMDTTSNSSMQFTVAIPYVATITDGYRGSYTFTAADYTAMSGSCRITFGFNDAVNIPKSHVTVYVVRLASSQVSPDYVGNGANSLFGYIGEDVYVHNDSTQLRCNLYNDQKTSAVKVVANQPPTVKKIYDSMEYQANQKYDITSVAIPADKTYPYGMTSKIPEARFVLREGVYYSEFMRNQKTNQSTASDLDLLRGEELRGQVAEITMVNDDTSECNLFSVTVNSSKSKS